MASEPGLPSVLGSSHIPVGHPPPPHHSQALAFVACVLVRLSCSSRPQMTLSSLLSTYSGNKMICCAERMTRQLCILMAAVNQLFLASNRTCCVSGCGLRLVLPDSTPQSPWWLQNATVLELSKKSHISLLLMKLRLMNR